MSKTYEAETTLTVRGEERDVTVRCKVDLEWDHGYPTASLDGGIQVLVGKEWLDGEDVLSASDLEHAEDVLAELALEDDSDVCEEDDDPRWEAAS